MKPQTCMVLYIILFILDIALVQAIPHIKDALNMTMRFSKKEFDRNLSKGNTNRLLKKAKKGVRWKASVSCDKKLRRNPQVPIILQTNNCQSSTEKKSRKWNERLPYELILRKRFGGLSNNQLINFNTQKYRKHFRFNRLPQNDEPIKLLLSWNADMRSQHRSGITTIWKESLRLCMKNFVT